MRPGLFVSISAIALAALAGPAIAQEKGGPGQAPQQSAPAQQSAPSARQGGAEMKGGGESKGGEAQQQRMDQPSRAQDRRTQPRDSQAQDKSAPKSDKKAGTKSGQGATTGQGAAAPSGAALTAEQRTKISTTIRQRNVRPVTNVNFNLSVGTVVPRSLTLHALPAAVIEVYPQWRGYRFILVADEIIIVEPDSYRIVAVIDA